jgi:predicted DsbA family dithiol-disulfide isomerase
LRIEIVTDLVCPWCWLGKRRLELALEQRPDLEVEISWLPHELNPGMPESGVPRAAWLASRFPDAAERDTRQRELARLGSEVGIDFRFDRIERVPNTRAAHALVYLARESGCADAVIEALFRGYFAQGRDIGDLAVLADVASLCGMDAAAVMERLRARADYDRVVVLERMIENAGIEAVPHYVFDGRYSCTGAQEVSAFRRALDRAA